MCFSLVTNRIGHVELMSLIRQCQHLSLRILQFSCEFFHGAFASPYEPNQESAWHRRGIAAFFVQHLILGEQATNGHKAVV